MVKVVKSPLIFFLREREWDLKRERKESYVHRILLYPIDLSDEVFRKGFFVQLKKCSIKEKS